MKRAVTSRRARSTCGQCLLFTLGLVALPGSSCLAADGDRTIVLENADAIVFAYGFRLHSPFVIEGLGDDADTVRINGFAYSPRTRHPHGRPLESEAETAVTDTLILRLSAIKGELRTILRAQTEEMRGRGMSDSEKIRRHAELFRRVPGVESVEEDVWGLHVEYEGFPHEDHYEIDLREEIPPSPTEKEKRAGRAKRREVDVYILINSIKNGLFVTFGRGYFSTDPLRDIDRDRLDALIEQVRSGNTPAVQDLLGTPLDSRTLLGEIRRAAKTEAQDSTRSLDSEE